MASKELCESESGFTFYWKVKHFSLCSLLNRFRSPVFRVEEIDKSEWCLCLSREGDTKDSFSLNMCSEGVVQKPILVDIELFMLKTNGDKEKVIEENVELSKYISFNSIDLLEIKLNTIFENFELYLPDDTLTVGCCIKKRLDSASVSTECTAYTEMSTELFSSISFFEILDGSHRYNMTPMTKNAESEKYPNFEIVIEFFVSSQFAKITRVKIEMAKSNFKVLSKCKLFIHNMKRDIVFFFEGSNMYLADRDYQSWDLKNSITSNAEEPRLSKESIFIVRCVLFASDGKHTSQIKNAIHPYLARKTKEQKSPKISSVLSIKEKLKCLHAESRLCDFTLRVDGEDFPIHKAVLGAVSPVFCAMFELEMKEKENSVSIIKDIDANTMKKLIDFTYTEKIEVLEWESVIKLYDAANKYLIAELKQFCTDWIIANLAIDNVTEVLAISDLYQDSELEKAAGEFVFAHANLVFRSENWKTFVSSKVVIANKIMQELCMKFTFNHIS